MPSWQRDFASGLIILVPILVTIIFLAWIYSYLARVPIPLDSGPVRVLLTLTIFVLLGFSVGYLMRTAVGSVLESALDDLMNQLPGLRVIYNASKMAVETAVGGTEELQKPVRLEVWDDIRMTAFKTGNTAPDGREILFMPTAPNITTGFVLEVEEDRYVEIDDSVEDALTRLLSAGFGNNEPEVPVGEIFSSLDDGESADGEVPVGEVGTGATDDPSTDTEGGDTAADSSDDSGDNTGDRDVDPDAGETTITDGSGESTPTDTDAPTDTGVSSGGTDTGTTPETQATDSTDGENTRGE